MRGDKVINGHEDLTDYRVKIGIHTQQHLMQFLHRCYPTRAELAVEVAVKHRIAHEHRLAITAHAFDGEILYPVQSHLAQE